MKLFIDTSNTTNIIIGLDNERFEEESRKNKSQMLLPLIVEKLKVKGKSLNDLSEIEVVLGPGSFTGLRVGLSVANALSWALDIPINGSKKLSEAVY